MSFFQPKHLGKMTSIFILAMISFACSNPEITKEETNMDPKQKEYWYGGEAEITSYKLVQARYGELREGTSVMVFVTEPFSKKSMTKADRSSDSNVPVLKLNQTKNFITGIYPYSMMTSSFLPFDKGDHSLKISSSSQEWCGHSFMELENSGKFNIETRSYFEGESGKTSLSKSYLEDDIWSLIRLRPESLPTGQTEMIPSFFYIRLAHIPTKAYKANAKNMVHDNGTSSYVIEYPELDRSLAIEYETAFPHKIISWNESYMDGFGSNKVKLNTTGTAIKTIKSAYWGQHSNSDEGLRTELGLDK